MRRALLTGRAPGVLLLAAWPLLPLVQLALVVAGAAPAWSLLGESREELAGHIVDNSHDYLVNALWATAGGVLGLLLWAFRTARSSGPGHANSDGIPSRYLTASLFPLVLVALTLVPGAADPEDPVRASAPVPVTGAPPPSPTVPVPSPAPSPTPAPTTPSPGPSRTVEPSAPGPTPDGSTSTDDGSSPDADGTAGKGNPRVAGQSLPATYEVTLAGTAGGTAFERTARLRVLDTITEIGITNDLNAVDVCLVSGEPAGRPEAGAIWYGSNSNCRPSNTGTAMDLGYVTVNGGTITVEPDERIAATLSNNFTTSDDYLHAGLYAPVGGSLRVELDTDGTVSGTVDLQGYVGAGYGNATYRASISGSRS